MCLTFFSSRNMSTAIFFTLNHFPLFDRKKFSQTFRSCMQRILRAVPHTIDNYRSILPIRTVITTTITTATTSIHSLAMSTYNLLPFSFIEHHRTIFRSFAFRKLIESLSFLSTAFSFNNHIYGRSSSNQSYLLSNVYFAIRLVFTSTNCINIL